MKKLVLVFTLLLGVMGLALGCSCNKDVYKFDSVIINDGTDETKYTCSSKEKKDSSIKIMCENYENFTIELKDDDTMIVNWKFSNMENEEANYKVENGFLYMEDEEEWMTFAKYSDSTLEIQVGKVKVILKK